MTHANASRLVLLGLLLFSIVAHSQSITRVAVKETGCSYTVGRSTTQCSLAPGMTLIITGKNLGQPGIVKLCDCGPAQIQTWTASKIVAQVEYVTPNAAVAVETITGAWSNSVPYVALAPVITSIDVGTCTFVANQSTKQCVILPGAEITIHGKYFGRGGQVATCDCASATIISWDPDWTTHASPYNDTIVATATDAVCGSSVSVEVMGVWSNPVPYTTCG